MDSDPVLTPMCETNLNGHVVPLGGVSPNTILSVFFQ